MNHQDREYEELQSVFGWDSGLAKEILRLVHELVRLQTRLLAHKLESKRVSKNSELNHRTYTRKCTVVKLSTGNKNRTAV